MKLTVDEAERLGGEEALPPGVVFFTSFLGHLPVLLPHLPVAPRVRLRLPNFRASLQLLHHVAGLTSRAVLKN